MRSTTTHRLHPSSAGSFATAGDDAVRAPGRLFAGYAFDLDGTLYLGDGVLPGAVEAVGAVRRHGRAVVFLTNNPLLPASAYAAKLRRLGIPARDDEVVTAVDSLVSYLEEAHPSDTLMIVAEPPLHRRLGEAGFRLTEDPEATDVVVVSFDRTFDYAKLTAAYRAVRLHGATVVATNPDPYCPTPDGGLPDCAAMLAAVEACTGVTAEAVTGKPSEHMARALLARLGVDAGDAVMIGDRLLTDVAMAEAAGLAGVLVLTGATDLAQLAASPVQPRYVIETLHQLLPGG